MTGIRTINKSMKWKWKKMKNQFKLHLWTNVLVCLFISSLNMFSMNNLEQSLKNLYASYLAPKHGQLIQKIASERAWNNGAWSSRDQHIAKSRLLTWEWHSWPGTLTDEFQSVSVCVESFCCAVPNWPKVLMIKP